MKIIIPASGSGERFKTAGYKDTKPLINVNDKRILDYVIDSFSITDEFYVITSKETFFAVEEFLKCKNINYKHFLYEGVKAGPVGAIVGTLDKLSQHISDDDKVIVSYCDYGMEWDYNDFKSYVEITNCDGAIPCYTGYHPHLENPKNVYACCKVLDNSDDIYEVKEKYKSDDRYNENWSAGLYYFSKFKTMKYAFDKMIEAKDMLNGEYYVSLAYNYLNDYTLKSYNKIHKFYQFGTPVDFEYAKSKINSLEFINNYDKIENTVILSAGKGERFLNLNYAQPKPFLPLNNKALVQNISETFNNVDTNIRFVGSEAHKIYWENVNIQNVKLIEPNKIGAAYSYKLGCSDLEGETLIVPCDLLAKHITEEFIKLKTKSDVIIFTSSPTKYNINNPNSFAWVIGENNVVKDITIKERINETEFEETVLIGSFWVRDNRELLSNIDEIFNKKFKVKDEYYLDNAFKNMLDNKLKINYIKLDNYFSLGTPDEYKENTYWIEK